MKGWVKIHRSILKSGTFKKLNLLQQLIALYIIINANHEDGVWHDKYKNISVQVKRGEQVVSIDKIIGWFDGDKEVTIAKVRKTLEKLIANGFITTRTTNNYTVINVVNYGIYQDKEEENNKQDNKEMTKGNQRDDKGMTTNKNDKNDKNDNNEKKGDNKEITVVASAKPKRTSKKDEYDPNKYKTRKTDLLLFEDDVYMTSKEYDTLVNKYGKGKTDYMINYYNSYVIQEGYRENKESKNDYIGVNKWLAGGYGNYKEDKINTTKQEKSDNAIIDFVPNENGLLRLEE